MRNLGNRLYQERLSGVALFRPVEFLIYDTMWYLAVTGAGGWLKPEWKSIRNAAKLEIDEQF